MTITIRRIASVLQLLYGWMLIAVGLAGIFTPRWELRNIFGLDPTLWPKPVQATFLNQYRFLKSMEFGAGLFCIGFRPAIMTGGRASSIFLAIVAAGVAARSIAWIADGTPDPVFVVFLVLEIFVLVAVAAHLRVAHAALG